MTACSGLHLWAAGLVEVSSLPGTWDGLARQPEDLVAELSSVILLCSLSSLSQPQKEGRIRASKPFLSTGSLHRAQESLRPLLADTPDQPPLGHFLPSLFSPQFGAWSWHSASLPMEGCSSSLNYSDNQSGLPCSLLTVQ